MRPHRFAIVCACLLLAACGGDKTASSHAQPGQNDLPKPDVVSGSVTGMPNPGAPSAQTGPAAAVPDMDAANGIEDSMPEAPPQSIDLPAPGNDDTDTAVLTLRSYYLAINAHDFARAYAQWSDGGRASGQSPQQFADGFAETQGVSVEFGQPGPIEGAAGSRYIEIPATLDAHQADGSIRHYAGSFTLRMTVVDGDSAAQRNWHIAAAGLHEVHP